MDRFFKKHFGRISTQRLLTSAFSLLLLISVASTAYLLMSSANRIVGKVATDAANATTRQVSVEVARFLKTPSIIGQSVTNAVLAGYVDIADEQAVIRFMHDLPQRTADYGVSGVFIADPQGNFLGVNSEIKDDATHWAIFQSTPQTDGLLCKYAITPEGTAGTVIEEGSAFNATTRPWFKEAIASDSPIWTDIYLDVSTGQPVLTWASTLRDSNARLLGVVGVDLLLPRIQQFMAHLPVSDNSTVFLADGDGTLIIDRFATPTSKQNNPVAPNALATHYTADVLEYLQLNHRGISSFDTPFETQVNLNGTRGQLKVLPMKDSIEVAWSVGIFIPLSDYLSSLGGQLIRIIPLGLLTCFIVWFALQHFTRLTVKPISQLRSSANRIAQGKFNVHVDTSCSNEVGDLASAIESMRKRLKNTFAELTRQKVQAETTLGSITDCVITVSNNGAIAYMNPAAEKRTGWPMVDALDKSIEDVFCASEPHTGEVLSTAKILSAMQDDALFNRELEMLDATANSRTIECRISPVITSSHHKASGAVLVFSDITEQVRLKTELLRQASVDDLTGLMNRRQFDQVLKHSIDDAHANNSAHCLCYMDLDQFKVINDTCGHVAGDELLRQIARVLRGQTRASDTLARLGGDEFALILHGCQVEQAAAVTNSLLKAISDYRFLWENQVFSVGISIGIVPIDASSGSAINALSDADSACYTAKDAGRNRVHVFSTDSEVLANRREQLQLVSKIDYALQNGRFVLYAQEIAPANHNADRGCHFEILVRMKDEDNSLISPGLFLPTAEQYSQASQIDRWVLSSTLNYLENHPALVSRIEVCSINLSGQSLGDENFLPYLAQLLDATKVPATKICFEVTETAAIANLNHAQMLMSTLRAKGCTFALDDFGSGFSSLAYLKTLPFDYLKIDGVFIRDIIDDKQDLAMVKLINDIGHTMGMQTIAEFVENEEIKQLLTGMGIDHLQGYAIAKPKPVEMLLQSHLALPEPA